MLRTVGVEFDVAQNGKEAVDLITAGGDDRKKWHDIVLMDVQMPVMDGLQVRRQWHDSGRQVLAFQLGIDSFGQSRSSNAVNHYDKKKGGFRFLSRLF
jgi:CheY-like chemotaxis protein